MTGFLRIAHGDAANAGVPQHASAVSAQTAMLSLAVTSLSRWPRRAPDHLQNVVDVEAVGEARHLWEATGEWHQRAVAIVVAGLCIEEDACAQCRRSSEQIVNRHDHIAIFGLAAVSIVHGVLLTAACR